MPSSVISISCCALFIMKKSVKYVYNIQTGFTQAENTSTVEKITGSEELMQKKW